MIQVNDCILLCKIIKEGKNVESKSINNIEEALNYINKGKFQLNVLNNSNQNEKYSQLKSKCYEKNNNIIIDFEKKDGCALLFMNTTTTLQNLDNNNIYIINCKEPRVNNFQSKMNLFNEILNNNTKNIVNNLKTIIPAKKLIANHMKKMKSENLIVHNKNKDMKGKIHIEVEKYDKKQGFKNNQIRINIRQKSDPNKIIIKKKIEDIHNSQNSNLNNSSHNHKNKNINKKKLLHILKKQVNRNSNLKLNENLEKNFQTENNIHHKVRNININQNKFMLFNNNKDELKIIKIEPKKENHKDINEFGELNQLERLKKINKLYEIENKKLKIDNEKLKELEKELTEKKAIIEKLKIECDKKKKELDRIINLNENQQNLQNELKNSNENYRIQNNNLNEEIKQKNKEVENLKNQITALNNQLKKIIDNYEQNKSEEIKKLRIKIEELEKQLKISQENNEKKNIELQENKKIIKELRDEMRKLKEEIKIKNQEIKELNKKIKKYEELIENNNKNVQDLKPNHDYIEDKNNIKNKRIEIYAKNMSEINQEKIDEKNKLKEKEIESLKNDIINMQKTAKSLTEENNELKKKEKELDKLLNQKEKEISNLKIINKELQKKSENESKLMNEYKTKLNNCINDIKNSEQNIESLTKQIMEYQKNEKRYQNLDKKEKELNLRINDINKKEKEINERRLFLENEANLMESEHQKINLQIQNYIKLNNQLKSENDNLMQENQNLQIQLMNYQKMISNFMPNPPQNHFIPNEKNNILQPQNNQINIINNNNNKIIPKKEIEPIKKYPKPTLIGLNNIGATCFMNATLQCLSQTEPLTNYFLKEQNRNKIINNNIAKKNKDENQLSPDYLELIQKLWELNGPKSFSPNNFMNKINNMNPLFKRGEAGDAKDFIIFVLEQMHKELKMPLSQEIMNNNIDNIPLNQYDKMNAFNHFFEDFKKETSILTDTFFGFSETTNICLYCKNSYNSKGLANPILFNYGIFNVLIFPLDEVKNMKINMGQNIINTSSGIPIVTLYDCFMYNQKTDYFTGENKNFCNICRKLYDSQYTSKIFVSPNVLIMILNRGKGNIYKIKLDFQLTIDITDFVIQKEKPRIKYNLYGVITHLGESGPNAHFVATCKSPVDNNWYRYNDALVDPVCNFQKDIYDFGNPYILFYEKEK